MRSGIAFVLVVTIVGSGCAGPRQGDQLPTYDCVHINKRLYVDGRLDEPQWQLAQPLSLVLTDTGQPPTFPTVARMLWNDTFLYVGFVSEDENVQAYMNHTDDDLWREDEVVEVFFAPAENLEYYEFQVNPQNARIDLGCVASSPDGESKRCDKEWNCTGWYSAVTVDGTLNNVYDKDRGWTCELAIPFESILPAKPVRAGDTWRLNLYRINRVPWGIEFSAWSPTGAINYHVPEKFGICRFVKPDHADTPPGPTATPADQ